MKKGKTCKINGFRTFKSQYGTIDSQNLKSIYLNLQTWAEPKEEMDNWSRIVLNMTRNVKHSVFENLDKTIFDEKFIVDLDLRTSGIQKNKRSFLNLEITLFVHNRSFEFKSLILRSKIKKILQAIYKDDLQNSKYFTLSKTKTKETITV